MSIKKIYSKEILDVRNAINLVRKDEVSDYSEVRTHGSFSTRAKDIEDSFDHLLDLIEHDLPNLRESIQIAKKEKKERENK